MPRKIFQGLFFFSDRNLGVRRCHEGVKSVCGPEAEDGIYDAAVDVIRWIFSSSTGGACFCPSPPLINPLSGSECGAVTLRDPLLSARRSFEEQ